MKKQYSSRNAEILRSLLGRLNKTGIFGYGFTTRFAEENGLVLTSVRNALKGQSAAIETQEAIITWAEKELGATPSRPAVLDYSHFSIPELIEQRILPFNYMEQAAQIAGTTQNAVGWFVKNQRDGSKRYATTEATEKALYQLAGYNLERELIHRLERLLERLEKQR